MEKEQILLNGSILLKNHKGYKNIHYLVQTDNVDEFMTFTQELEESIEVVYRSRQIDENIMYVKAVTSIDFKEFSLLEKIEWESYNIVFPWKWDGTGEFLLDLPEDNPEESPPLQENLNGDSDFRITKDIRQLLYWYKVNLRLPDVPIMKETGFDHRKVKTLRKCILANSIIHFPTFLHGARHYVCLYFSFFTKYYEFFMDFFAKNSGTSYLIGGKNGRTFLFVNTTRPGWVLHAMETFEKRGIILKVFFCYLQERWDLIMEDFKSGKIPEKYFWMFGAPKKEEGK